MMEQEFQLHWKPSLNEFRDAIGEGGGIFINMRLKAVLEHIWRWTWCYVWVLLGVYLIVVDVEVLDWVEGLMGTETEYCGYSVIMGT